MSIVWLRYQNTGAAVTRRFDALQCYALSDHAGEGGISLQSIRYNHRLAAWLRYDLVISADQLFDPAAKAFLDAWYDGGARWLSLNPALIEPAVATETEFAGDIATLFIRVELERATLPVEFLEGNKLLPQFAATINSKYPRAWS